MIPVVGPFLLLGILCWVGAIVTGVTSWFGLTPWRRRWAVAGALAGAGTFELYLYANGGALPLLTPDPGLVFPATAALFVGCGVAAAYGTLFAPERDGRPGLEPDSAEETLWLHDVVDRLSPSPLDWLLTGAMLLPGLGMLHLGLNLASELELAAVGVVGLVGPAFGALGLALRKRASTEYLAELEERRARLGSLAGVRGLGGEGVQSFLEDER